MGWGRPGCGIKYECLCWGFETKQRGRLSMESISSGAQSEAEELPHGQTAVLELILTPRQWFNVPPKCCQKSRGFIYISVSAWQQRSAWLPYNKCAGEDTSEWLWMGRWRKDHSKVAHMSEETPAGGRWKGLRWGHNPSPTPPHWESMVTQCGEFCVMHMLFWKNTKALWYQGLSTIVNSLCEMESYIKTISK